MFLWLRSGAGSALSGLPTRKYPGVKAWIPSAGADSSGMSGRLLRTTSTSAKMEYNSSTDNKCVPTDFVSKVFFILRSVASHSPVSEQASVSS